MRKFTALLFALALGLAAPAAVASEATPVVEEFHAGLVAVMKEGKVLGVKGRYDRIGPLLDKAFHLPVMIRVASGKHWRGASDEDRQALVAAFRHMSTATYAAQFKSHGGEKFETVEEKPGPQNTTLVHTRLVLTDSDPVDLTYVTKKGKSGWRVVDVLLDNDISELAVRRSEYALVLGNEGVAGLVALLNGKADELLSQ